MSKLTAFGKHKEIAAIPKGRLYRMRYHSVRKELKAMDTVARILIPLSPRKREKVMRSVMPVAEPAPPAKAHKGE